MSDPLMKPGAKKEPGLSAARPGGSGVVRYYIHGTSDKLAEAQFSAPKLVAALETGLPVRELTELQESLEVSVEDLAPMLGISKATFHRSMAAGGKLKPVVSDRVVRFARLLGQAVKVFGEMGDAKEWLSSPQFGLGGAVPLEYAKSEVGAREVENLLGRIEHGVYS